MDGNGLLNTIGVPMEQNGGFVRAATSGSGQSVVWAFGFGMKCSRSVLFTHDSHRLHKRVEMIGEL